jgi:L-iditol 2-dehydrogenase
MRQAVMTKPGTIELREAARPVPGQGEVLLRIKRIGVCGSDIHVWHGLHPYTSYPVVQGHEVSGSIEELGPGAAALAPAIKLGALATFMPQLTCGTCYPCRSGNYHICDSLRVMGFQAPGAGQDYFAVAADKIVLLPPGLSAEGGAMIEPMAVAVHALRRGGGAAGKKVAVVGAGPIGNLVAQVAKAQGAREVIIMDKSAYRLKLALECGADHAVDASSEALADAIAKHFGPDKADLILECIGAEPTMTQAILSARKGSTVVVVGVFGKKPTVDLGLVQDRELSLVGTLMYRAEDYVDAVALAAAGKMALDRLVTDRYKFEDYAEAYRYIEKAGDKAMKVMITLD